MPLPNLPILKLGASGPHVFRLQERLRRVGVSVIVDGVFSSVTHEAVLEFQRSHPPLVVDGIVGPKTHAALRGALPWLLGIDISRHQRPEDLDYQALVKRDPDGLPHGRSDGLVGIQFALVRATMGERGEDVHWRTHVRELARVGVPFIALYHLVSAWQSPIVQAEHFCRALEAVGEIDGDPNAEIASPMLDIEWTLDAAHKADQLRLAGPATAEIARLVAERAGQQPTIYTAPYFVKQSVAAAGAPWPEDLGRCPLHLAAFTGGFPVNEALPDETRAPAPWEHVDVLQFDGDRGLVVRPISPGKRTVDVDFNIFLGTCEDFARSIGARFEEEDTTP